MNPTPLLQRLLAAARREVPSDHVPYAFEKRIRARLTRLPAPDPWAAWGAILWRALAPCCAIMLAIGLVGALTARSPELAGEDSLENVLLATLDNGPDAP